MAWSDTFEEPIVLPDGRELVTFEEAGRYIQQLPKKTQALDHWQTATWILIAAAEGRDFSMHARIAMLRALNHGKPDPEKPLVRQKAKRYRIIR